MVSKGCPCSAGELRTAAQTIIHANARMRSFPFIEVDHRLLRKMRTHFSRGRAPCAAWVLSRVERLVMFFCVNALTSIKARFVKAHLVRDSK
jgi:hypothetical protein